MNMIDRIKQRMLELDITQEALAQAMGVTQPAIHKLLVGLTKRTTRLPELISALKTTQEWLVDGVGPKEPVVHPKNQEFYRAFESMPEEEQEAIRVLVLRRQAQAQAQAQEPLCKIGRRPPVKFFPSSPSPERRTG
jgi:predicted transcriptional regulator